MGDEKLRDLERRWRQTGSVGDEAAYLLERVRVGDLLPTKLELAAYCGHAGASRACNQSALRSQPRASDDLGEWSTELAPWGREALVVAAIASAELFLASLNGSARRRKVHYQAVLATARAWLESPTQETRDAAMAAWDTHTMATPPHNAAWLAAHEDLDPPALSESLRASSEVAGQEAVRRSVLLALIQFALGPAATS
jgi:hypothetical protein